MQRLPAQLSWRAFEAVLAKLGYTLHKSGSGAARTYYNLNHDPKFVTFHEPHSPSTLAKGTLREYVRKLRLSREEFLKLLE